VFSQSKFTKLIVVAISFRSRALTALRNLFKDALYRGSLILLTNTAAMSAIGFVFWTLAARRYPSSAVGVFASLTSGVSLLAAISALGLQNTMIRHIAGAENQRELVTAAVAAIATVGTIFCIITVLVFGPHLPSVLHLQQRGTTALLITTLVVFTAISGVLDAGLVAIRASYAVLITNMLGSIVKVAALFVLTSFRSSGLLISYGLGLVLATVLSGVALARQIGGKGVRFRSFRALRHYLSMSSGNYPAAIMGILPSSVVPLEVLAVLGATATAHFAVAFLIAGFLNVIPSTVAQVLFAEASRQGATLGRQLRKALRGVYGLLLPAVVIVVAAAPLVLRLFGTAYAEGATGCLRVLALSTFLTGGTYLVDSLLIARDRTAAYVFMNGANAALVLACVAILLPRGLAAAAAGWALAQGISLLLGLIVVATGTVGQHHPRISRVLTGRKVRYPQRGMRPVIYAFEPQIRELLAAWPMMPTTLIAESIGWNQPIRVLLDHVSELRSEYSHPYDHPGPTGYSAGRTAQCGLWFPPSEVPVGVGQTRPAHQLPVLTVITGYSGWLSAMLLPSRHSQDLFAGLWELLVTLGAAPRELTWDNDVAICQWRAGKMEFTNECREFCYVLGVNIIIGGSADTKTRGLIEQAHVELERSFLPGRSFASPMDFNAQLRDWLDTANTHRRQPPNRSPIDLISADRQAMLSLPLAPPQTRWQLSMKIGSMPFFYFDSNYYSLHRTAIGRQIEVIADVHHVRALCEGKVVADHDRAWTFERTISDPSHLALLGPKPI
jgi:O-antigen/teichoic acid export membrane protein